MTHATIIFVSTQFEFKEANPKDTECVQCIAVSHTGEIHTAYFNGNTDIDSLVSFVRSYVYVNEWKVSIQTISLV